MHRSNFSSADVDEKIIERILEYARLLSARGHVVNTLGNIAVRTLSDIYPPHGVVYTKHLGVSLEEMTSDNIVVTDIPDGNLLYGLTSPSIGHVMTRTILRLRPDINAIIHLHPNDLIAYFSVTIEKRFRYISADSALVLSRPVHILDPNINVEIDTELIEGFISKTNCIIMPNHGITALGRTVSEAYHRAISTIAEVQRIIMAMQISKLTGKPIQWITEEETLHMYNESERIIYGGK
jgi:L-fuculose-phosphate aldolase